MARAIRYVSKYTAVGANFGIVANMHAVCNANLAGQQCAVTDNNATRQSNTRRQKAFSTDNNAVCNLAQIVDFCAVANTCVCHCATVNARICAHRYTITDNNTSNVRNKYIVSVLAGIAESVLANYGAGIYNAVRPDCCIFYMCASLDNSVCTNGDIASDVCAGIDFYIF